jgi:hypothetical protein
MRSPALGAIGPFFSLLFRDERQLKPAVVRNELKRGYVSAVLRKSEVDIN